MAAPCLGTFGAYKLAYNKYKKDLERLRFSNQNQREQAPIFWVKRRHDPLDTRCTAPIPAQKLMRPSTTNTVQVPTYWIPPGDVHPKTYFQSSESPYRSQPSTRCEEWSTLRQMLPSRGTPLPNITRPPSNWGTGQSYPPVTSNVYRRQFYHVNSPMTRYVDAMHVNDPMFRLH